MQDSITELACIPLRSLHASCWRKVHCPYTLQKHLLQSATCTTAPPAPRSTTDMPCILMQTTLPKSAKRLQSAPPPCAAPSAARPIIHVQDACMQPDATSLAVAQHIKAQTPCRAPPCPALLGCRPSTARGLRGASTASVALIRICIITAGSSRYAHHQAALSLLLVLPYPQPSTSSKL